MPERRLLYIPGWAHTGAEFWPVSRALAPAGILVQIVSARTLLSGGGSCAPASSLLNGASLLVGWSLGAMAILTLLARGVTQNTEILLLAPTPRFVASDDFPSGVPTSELVALKRLFIRDPKMALAQFFSQLRIDSYDDNTRQQRMSDALQLDKQELLWGLDFLERTDLRAELTRSDASVAAIYGMRDRVVKPASTLWFAEQLHWPCQGVDSGHDLLSGAAEFVISEIRQRFL